MMTATAREAFARGPEADAGKGNDNDAAGPDRRDHFTPLWKTKGAHSFGGGLLQPVPGSGTVPGSTMVENEGFVPLRKVRGKSILCLEFCCFSGLVLGWVDGWLW